MIENRVFDYRFSRPCRIIENSFGILAAQFRIFRRPINAQVETVCSITKTAVTLHKYLMKSSCISGEYTIILEKKENASGEQKLLAILAWFQQHILVQTTIPGWQKKCVIDSSDTSHQTKVWLVGSLTMSHA